MIPRCSDAPRWLVDGGFFERHRFPTGTMLHAGYTRTSNALVRRAELCFAERPVRRALRPDRRRGHQPVRAPDRRRRLASSRWTPPSSTNTCPRRARPCAAATAPVLPRHRDGTPRRDDRPHRLLAAAWPPRSPRCSVHGAAGLLLFPFSKVRALRLLLWAARRPRAPGVSARLRAPAVRVRLRRRRYRPAGKRACGMSEIAPVAADATRPFWSVMIPTYRPNRDFLGQSPRRRAGARPRQRRDGDRHRRRRLARLRSRRPARRGDAPPRRLRATGSCGHREELERVHPPRTRPLGAHSSSGRSRPARVLRAAARRLRDGAGRRGGVLSRRRHRRARRQEMGTDTHPRHGRHRRRLGRALFVGLHLRAPALVVRREVYEALGGFRLDLDYALDWDMWKRIAAAYPMWYEPEVLACYRRHRASASFRHMRSGENIAEIGRSIELSRDELPPAIAADVTRRTRRNYTRYAVESAWRTLMDGDVASCWAQVRAACRISSAARRGAGDRSIPASSAPRAAMSETPPVPQLERKLFFLHVPKCGGTSVDAAIGAFFPAEARARLELERRPRGGSPRRCERGTIHAASAAVLPRPASPALRQRALSVLRGGVSSVQGRVGLRHRSSPPCVAMVLALLLRPLQSGHPPQD